MNGCINEQARLDAISNRLAGTVSDYSAEGVLNLIQLNVRSGIIAAADGAALSAEVTRLASRAEKVLAVR